MLEELKEKAQVKIKSSINQNDRNKFYWSMTWINLKREILKRDNYECQVCKHSGKVALRSKTRLIVHHVRPLEYYPDLRLEPSNLLTVCISCHNLIHFETEESDEWW